MCFFATASQQTELPVYTAADIPNLTQEKQHKNAAIRVDRYFHSVALSSDQFK